MELIELKKSSLKLMFNENNLLLSGDDWSFKFTNCDKERIDKFIKSNDISAAEYTALNVYYNFCNQFQSC